MQDEELSERTFENEINYEKYGAGFVKWTKTMR